MSATKQSNFGSLKLPGIFPPYQGGIQGGPRTFRTRTVSLDEKPLLTSRGTEWRRPAMGHWTLGLLALVPIAALGAAAGRSAPGTYTIIDLGTLGGATSVALGVNDLGQVCGEADIPGGLRHAFLWDDGVMTDLGTIGSTTQSGAWDVNNAGTVVGWSSSNGIGGRGFIWENGEMKRLLETNTSIQAYGINDNRQVVGQYRAPTSTDHGFLWEDGVLTDLGTLGGSNSLAWDVNNSAQVVGRSFLAEGGEHAFLWEDGAMTDPGFLGPSNCEAFSINEAAQIVGYCQTFDGYTPVLWQDGEIVDLGAIIVDPVLSANEINNSGQILMANYLNVAGTETATFLEDLLPGDSGWSQLSGRAMNDNGQIVGVGTINGLRHAFLMDPPPAIPTVSAWAVALMVLALLAGATMLFGRSILNDQASVENPRKY